MGEMMNKRFEDKVVIVTGAARGQGRSHALAFAREGANLVIADIGRSIPVVPYGVAPKDKLVGVAEEIKELGQQVLPVTCDVTKSDEVQGMVQKAIKHFGKIDVLINNAGINTRGAKLWDLTEEEWKSVLNVNLTGVWLCCKYVIPHMIKQKSGKVINIGSSAAVINQSNNPSYAVSKAGVISLTKSLAQEVAEYNINVNAVSPGLIFTDMVKSCTPKGKTLDELEREFIETFQLFDRKISVDEVTKTILWLSSEETANITGQNIVIDAGLTIITPWRNWKG
jgi:NAD(P)-dependent dehydrogenase (short-subunit alcohol dehydrogenase family)